MQEVIDNIIVALSSIEAASVKNTAMMIDKLATNLEGKGDCYYDKYFPIAIVHSQERIKEEDIKREFLEQGILGRDGFTPTQIAREVCNQIAQSAAHYIQQVDIMVFITKNKNDTIEFHPKRPHDFWKKLRSSDGILAMVDMKYFTANESSKIEYELREVIRKRKENTSLKDVGFVWIAAVTDSEAVEGIFEHYFHQNHTQVKLSDGNCSYWIGWSNTLREISMRTFYAF